MYHETVITASITVRAWSTLIAC